MGPNKTKVEYYSCINVNLMYFNRQDCCQKVETVVEGFHDITKVNKMKYNLMGNTGMKVSQLGFGT